MQPLDVFHRSVEHWQDVLDGVHDGHWERPTPCSDWDVRGLVNHVVYEQVWVRPLLEGRTVEEVGDAYEGDLLGSSPHAAAARAAADAREVFAEEHASLRTVHLSGGDAPATDYAMELAADHLLHGWDLAAGTGQDRHLPPGLVDAIAVWFTADKEEEYRQMGAIAARVRLPDDASAQDRLVAAFGRDPGWQPVNGR